MTGMLPLDRRVIALMALLLMTACAGSPGRPGGDQASSVAESMVGKPYRYGGDNPGRGFDCSGLVFYSYRQAGVRVPRSTSGQRRASQRISKSDLAPGDLVFFDQEGKRSSHVGIYVGDQRFVHAPSSGKRVRVDSIRDRYWKKHFVDARRFF